MLTNPNKVNQYTPADIRQTAFAEFYIDPISHTFGNVHQSALAAGYEESYARALTGHKPKWLYMLDVLVADERRKQKVERNLDKYLDLKTKQPVVTITGVLTDENGNVVERENPNLMDKQLRATFFVAERAMRDKYGKVDRVEGKHLHFSLSDLRKQEQAQKARESAISAQ